MLIKWIDEICILCKQKKLLTEEHAIPEQVGGILKSNILCKDCNDYLGHSIEASIKNDPSIRLAIEGIKFQAPELFDRMINRLTYIAKNKDGDVKGIFRKNEFNPLSHKKEDGSIIEPTHLAKKHIKRELEKRGESQETIELILHKIDDAPLDERIEIDNTIDIIKWGAKEIQPDLSGDKINDLFFLKIAYEFLSLHVGSHIYDQDYDLIRGLLLGHTDENTDYKVESFRTTKYEAFHGILIEQNHPITIQIRLFGWLVYKVIFPKLQLPKEQKRILYHHDLKSGVENVYDLTNIR
jgi:hypothetical protein